MLESEIQRSILDWLEAEGIWHRRLSLGAVKVKGARRRNPLIGFPDIFGLLRSGTGRMFVIEVKTKTGRMRPEQETVRRELETQGALYILARSLDDVVSTFQHYERFGA
jgi:hypothetical protein